MIQQNGKPDNFLGEQIEYGGKIYGAFFELYVGEVRSPDVIRISRELGKQQIGKLKRTFVFNLFPFLASSAVGFYAEQLHYAQNSLFVDFQMYGQPFVAVAWFFPKRQFNLLF